MKIENILAFFCKKRKEKKEENYTIIPPKAKTLEPLQEVELPKNTSLKYGSVVKVVKHSLN
jgi:hypothetical protein